MKNAFLHFWSRPVLAVLALTSFEATATAPVAPVAATAASCAVVGWATQNGGTTGGGTATPTVVNNYTDFANAITNAAVKVVHVSGTITVPAGGRISFQDQSGKTVYGLPGARLVSTDRTSSGSGILYVKRCSNLIIRNLTFEGPGAYDVDGNDNMTIDGCTNMWVDHCDFQDALDGNLDIKNAADYISITWCKFSYLKPPISGGSGGANDHRFSNLFGSSDSATGDQGKLRITMQYCWWGQGCVERMPRARFGKIHIVNNYFGCAGNNHCIRAGFEADMRVESNYFDNVNLPIDLFNNDFTAVSSINNTFVATTGNTAGSGTAFTPPYSLSIDASSTVKATVTSTSCGAGATMSSPTSCCGTTPPTTYTLTTTASPTAGGSIARSPNASSYNAGTVVTLTATPASGYTFSGWSGAASGSNATTTVTVNANITATATFTAIAPTTYTLTVSSNPTAGGTVALNPTGGSYAAGTVVTATATAASGYTFAGWSGASTASTASTTVTVNANATLTANFTANPPTTYTLTVARTPTAGGTVALNPTGGTYASGTVVTATATAASGYAFTGWSGASTATTASTSVTMTANKTLTATFTATGGGTTTLRIEDAAAFGNGYCAADGSRQNSYSGADNGYYINLSNASGKGIDWSVNAPAAGSYTLRWRYANAGSSSATTAKVLVNGATAVASTPFPKTAAWTTWATTTATVNLAAGVNAVRLETTVSSDFANIDWMEVFGNSPTVGACTAPRGAAVVAGGASAGTVRLYPNPATPGTVLEVLLPQAASVAMSLYNVLGQPIKTVGSQDFNAGLHTLALDAATLKPGIYTVVVGIGENRQTLRLLVQ